MMTNGPKLGLVLSGGGARSAYQAGVVAGLSEVFPAIGAGPLRLDIICGLSGGAINAGFLAAEAHRMPEAVRELRETWTNLRIEDVADTRTSRVMWTGLKLIFELGFGGSRSKHPTTKLLDTDPLVALLKKKIDFQKMRANIRSGVLHGVAITATHYGTGSTVTFFDGHPGIQPWMRSHRIGKRSRLTLKHVLASSSIPLLFPPVHLQKAFYGDGALRMTSPLSPAIHLGADRLIVIGSRHHRTPQDAYRLAETYRMKTVQLADIAGVFMNALFLDAVDSDLERMLRINQTLSLISEEDRAEHPERLRRIPVLAIRPSQDLGRMASDHLQRFSWMLRHLLKGLGASKQHGSDFVSYLAFDKRYTSRLVDLGYADVMAQKDEIAKWWAGASAGALGGL